MSMSKTFTKRETWMSHVAFQREIWYFLECLFVEEEHNDGSVWTSPLDKCLQCHCKVNLSVCLSEPTLTKNVYSINLKYTALIMFSNVRLKFFATCLSVCLSLSFWLIDFLSVCVSFCLFFLSLSVFVMLLFSSPDSNLFKGSFKGGPVSVVRRQQFH